MSSSFGKRNGLAYPKANGSDISNHRCQYQYSLEKYFEEGELDPKATIKDFFITATDGKNYKTNFH
jgi:hypothetical protein